MQDYRAYGACKLVTKTETYKIVSKMKNTSLFLSLIALAAVVTLGIITFTKDGKKVETVVEGETAASAEAGAIVYIDLNRILTEYDMANDLRSVV